MKQRIRPAKPSDLNAILNLFEQSILGSTPEYSQIQKQAWISGKDKRARWISRIAEQLFLLVFTGGELVAFASLKLPDYIDLMYVSPQHARKGIASQLLAQLEIKAVDEGATSLDTDASLSAMAFFKANGFEAIRKNQHNINGVSIVNYRMSKKLQPVNA